MGIRRRWRNIMKHHVDHDPNSHRFFRSNGRPSPFRRWWLVVILESLSLFLPSPNRFHPGDCFARKKLGAFTFYFLTSYLFLLNLLVREIALGIKSSLLQKPLGA